MSKAIERRSRALNFLNDPEAVRKTIRGKSAFAGSKRKARIEVVLQKSPTGDITPQIHLMAFPEVTAQEAKVIITDLVLGLFVDLFSKE